jgi:sugar/nucleoside kinase (ribokinase family)
MNRLWRSSTLSRGCRNELLGFLKEDTKELEAVVLPDFFQDRLIALKEDAEHFFSAVANVVKRKGGSMDGIVQSDLSGGNALNTASALAALGAKVTPIVCTDEFGLHRINSHLKPYGVDMSHIKLVAKPSKTTALELETQNGTANVMLRDLGSLANFGPSDLTESDYSLIERADYTCVFNWAGTRKFGTQLAETVFRRAKEKGSGKTYFDTADPTPNKEKVQELVRNILKTRHVDILSVNENEAIIYARLLNQEIDRQKTELTFEELALEAARILATNLTARIDLHTTIFSATVTKKTEVVAPAFKIRPLRATGAGDAWNAGNMVADGNSLSDQARLALANAVSACYLIDPVGRHPNRQRLTKFIEGLTGSK